MKQCITKIMGFLLLVALGFYGVGFYRLYNADNSPPAITTHAVPTEVTDIVPSRGTFNPQNLTTEQRKMVLMGFADGVWSMFTALGKLGVSEDNNLGTMVIAVALQIQEFDFTPDELRVAASELNALHISRTAY